MDGQPVWGAKGRLLVVAGTCRVERAGVDGVAVVVAVGEFDLATSDRLREALESAVSEVGPRVVVDLSDTSFLDSSCIGVLVVAGRDAHANGGWVRLLTPHDNVRRVLALTQVDELLGAYDDVGSAIAAPSGSWA